MQRNAKHDLHSLLFIHRQPVSLFRVIQREYENDRRLKKSFHSDSLDRLFIRRLYDDALCTVDHPERV